MKSWRALILVLGTSVATADAGIVHLGIEPGSKENEVVFESKATAESFEGRTRQAAGTIALDPAALGDSLELGVRVDMASLDTGIALRNRHMRENHLHTERFPDAAFEGAKILEGAGTSLTDGRPHELRIMGEMTLHGVTRTIEVPLRLQWEAAENGPALHLECRFPVALEDYEITRPRFLFLKLAEVQQVRVSLTARPLE